ncbi:MAG: PadR family transcriptional regulator [Ruminococcaceae bacterium]|nr:PadR family transcriptional regulator [Oscillospiraceae bacterium]
MPIDKSLLTGSTTVLILKLLEEKDMYGYEMIATLAQRSNHAFDLKAGTLYPLLHNLEKAGLVISYEQTAENERTRKYYRLTQQGKTALQNKEREWYTYADAVNRVLKGGLCCGSA